MLIGLIVRQTSMIRLEGTWIRALRAFQPFCDVGQRTMEINRSNSQVRHSRTLADPRSGGRSGGRPEVRSEETQNGPSTRAHSETVRMSIPNRVNKMLEKNEETYHNRIKELEKMYANLQKDLGSKIEMGDAVVKHLKAYKSKFPNNR